MGASEHLSLHPATHTVQERGSARRSLGQGTFYSGQRASQGLRCAEYPDCRRNRQTASGHALCVPGHHPRPPPHPGERGTIRRIRGTLYYIYRTPTLTSQSELTSFQALTDRAMCTDYSCKGCWESKRLHSSSAAETEMKRRDGHSGGSESDCQLQLLQKIKSHA